MDKAALLDAIAKSGSAGRAAYEQAQQSLAGQQSEAVRMALASGVAGRAPAGAQSELENIISQPYQSRIATLRQNQATMEDWYNRLGAARGAWADQQKALQDVALQQALAEASGGGGGGGRGGGGSGGGEGGTGDWYKDLVKTFGTWSNAKQAINDELVNLDWKSTGKSPTEAGREFLTEKYGISPEAAAGLVLPSGYETTYGSYAQNPSGYTRRQAKKILTSARKEKISQQPGTNVGYTRSKLKTAFEPQYGRKFVRRYLGGNKSGGRK
jgi:hypothetical protein